MKTTLKVLGAAALLLVLSTVEGEALMLALQTTVLDFAVQRGLVGLSLEKTQGRSSR
jgi:hypothetical protein